MYKLYAFFGLEQIDSTILKVFMNYLPEERKIKVLHYRWENDQKLSAVSYLLLLHALFKEYNICSPVVAYTDKGKPYLPDHPDIFFNISHCPYGCTCAVSDEPIGADIQDVRPFSWDIARRCCSQAEIIKLQQVCDPDVCFTRMWAMKESYLKMTGEGITRSLSKIDTTNAFRNIPTIMRNGCCIAVSSPLFLREDL